MHRYHSTHLSKFYIGKNRKIYHPSAVALTTDSDASNNNDNKCIKKSICYGIPAVVVKFALY